MAESLVTTKIIEDPQEVKEFFLKKYIDAEKSHHYDEKVHFPSQYTFYCDKTEFSKFIPQVLSPLTDVTNKTIKLLKEGHTVYEEYEHQIEEMIQHIDIVDVLLALFLVNVDEKAIASSCVTNVLSKPYIEDLVKHSLDENSNPNEDEMSEILSQDQKKLKALIYKVEEGLSSAVEAKTSETLLEFFTNSKQVNTHAIFCCSQGLQKVMGRVERCIDNIHSEDNDSHRKEFLTSSALLSRFCFLLFTASYDSEDMFYKKDSNEDIDLLSKNMKIIDFKDQWKDLNYYFVEYNKGCEQMHSGYAVGSHCLTQVPGIRQAMSYLSWSAIYWWKTKNAREDGMLFESMMDLNLLKKALSLRQENLAKDPENSVEEGLELNKIFYITKSMDDEITLDNLDDANLPSMVEDDLELPIFTDKSVYDDSEHVKVRVISGKDWNRVNWETGELIDEASEPAFVEKIILNIHGGSWSGGCSGEQLPITEKYTKETGCPVFAIDYRLAPVNKFPCGLSDCFQVYNWLTYYAEKYLQLRFNEIILDGDSAGGNLCLSLTAMLIKKSLDTPKSLSLHYPCASGDRLSFSPSLLLGVDDVMLNFAYLPMVLSIYTQQDFEKHPNLSVKNLDNKILAEFPPVKIVCGEMDPLRDEILRLAVKLLKNGVQTEVDMYRHQFHGFLGHAWFPIDNKMQKVGNNRVISHLNS